MSLTVCLVANCLTYPEGGGHLWAYLNWALGLRSLGCDVFWLEPADPALDEPKLNAYVTALRKNLVPFGLADRVALVSSAAQRLPELPAVKSLENVRNADLLLNLAYGIPESVVRSFPRSALVDIDPGQLQVWVSQGAMQLAQHDVYFSISEITGQPSASFPDLGLRWHHTPPPVALDWWPVRNGSTSKPFTTVSHWGHDWYHDGKVTYPNSKRDGFLPFLDLPKHTSHPLELALCLGDDPDELHALEARGWRVTDPAKVAGTPLAYQSYIQSSRAEFSCVKPSCIRMQNAWISDRTICYLGSGKPAVVQHTGNSRYLPEASGLFRFQNFSQAVQCVETVASDYENQCRLARELAEEHFAAHRVLKKVLEVALG